MAHNNNKKNDDNMLFIIILRQVKSLKIYLNIPMYNLKLEVSIFMSVSPAMLNH